MSGHTADGGVETPKASVSIHTANPAVTEIYTAHEGKRIGGGKGELKASVRIAGRLADYTGHFSYREKDGSSIQIGDVVTDGARLPSGEAEYRILWNAAGLPSGEYQVTFALTDPDGGKGLLEEAVIVDNSIPERISRVTAVGDLNKIVISWSLSHEIATKKYAVYRRAEDEEEFTKIREVQGRNTVSCEDTDVEEDVKYYYYVTGISDFGLESEASEEAAACRGTDAENPRVVQITPVKGSVIGGNTEFCARAADNVAVVRTELYRSEDGQSWTHLHTEEGAVCRYEWNVKENGGTGLWIKAAAYDAAGNAGTAIYNYTVDKEGPAQVQSLSWESTSSAVTLKWQDVPAPIITQISPAPGSFQDTISLTVTASDDVAVAEILLQTSGNRIFWDDLEKFSFQEDKKNQTVSYALDLSGYEEGPLYVRAVAKDRAGHEGNSSGSAPYVEYRIDRTAPSAPENFRADFRDGALFLAWDLGGEEDLYDYILYRSDDGWEFREIKTGLRYTSCYDRDAKRGETYAYQLAVRDQAGNVSKRTEAVTASVPEDEKPPELVSFLPDDGSVVGAGSDFYLLAKDNDELDIIEVSYQVNHGTSKNLLRQERIKNYYKEIETNMPFDELMDGDSLQVTVTLTDVQGIETERTLSYTVDKEAPRVQSVLAHGEEDRIALNWQGGGEADLSHYNIYRKTSGNSYQAIGQVQAKEDAGYSYEDANALAGEIYRYKIEAADRAGNVSAKESGDAWIAARPVIKAALTCDVTQAVNTEYEFLASGSKADKGIASYLIDYGDGQTAEPENGRAVHRYAQTGTYTVTLTVTDREGGVDFCTREVAVTDPKLIGAVEITLTDAGGAALTGMPVYFDMDNGPDYVKYTDALGKAQFTAEAGKYKVGSYANGYLPVQSSVVVRANDVTEYTIAMTKEQIVTGEFEVNRMTPDEIEAAGIFDAEEFNYHTFSGVVRLKYGTEENVEIPVIINGKTGDVVNGGHTQISSSKNNGSSTGELRDLKVMRVSENVIAVLDVPVMGSWLKEFFDVKLHIINHADSSFSLSNNRVKLNVPKGMALMRNLEGCDDLVTDFSSLKGQETKTLHWILRGETEGEYDLTADYSGVLDSFHTPVSAVFQTEEKIKVFGAKAMKLTVDIGKHIYNGAMYFNLSLTNVGEADIYYPSVGVIYNVIDVYEGERLKEAGEDILDMEDYYSIERLEEAKGDAEKARSVAILDIRHSNSNGYTTHLGPGGSVTTLSPGETYTQNCVCYEALTGDIETASLLNVAQNFGERTGIKVEINEVDIKPYNMENAEEKAEEILKDPGKKNLYDYIVDTDLIRKRGDSNFFYYRQAIKDDEDGFKKLGEALYTLTDCALNLDMDLFTKENTKDITRNYICELLQDESFQNAVDMNIDTSYLNMAQDVIGNIMGALPKDKTGEVDSSYGWDDFSEEFSGSKNLHKLASDLRKDGPDAVWDDILLTAARTLKTDNIEREIRNYLGRNQVVNWISEGASQELGKYSEILGAVSDAYAAWNESVEFTNQMMTIRAAREEAEYLLDAILDCPYINEAVYKEVKRIRASLTEGFELQVTRFLTEFLKKTAGKEGKAVLNTAIHLLDEYYQCDTGIGAIRTALILAFGTLDEMFGWEERVNELQRLRVTAALTIPLRSKAVTSSGAEKMTALKYLIKMRLLCEKTFVDVAKKNGSRSALKVINDYQGANYESLDDYYLDFKTKILSYRDSLYGETAADVAREPAPVLSVDYENECSVQSFDSSYEFSYDGVLWTKGSGGRISFSPGLSGQHLWLRKSASEGGLSGNVTKCYIPPRGRITGDIAVKYKNGAYAVSGLSSGRYEYAIKSETGSFHALEGEPATIEGEDYDAKLTLRRMAEEDAFKTEARDVSVEKAYNVRVSLKGAGTVSGGGEYFIGETVRLSAKALSGSSFEGWYDGTECLSPSETYEFLAYGDADIQARFSDCLHTDQEQIEIRGQREASCTAQGYSGDTYCKICGMKIADGEETPALMHLWDDGEITIPATAASEGEKTFTCRLCGGTKTEAIPKLKDPDTGGETETPNPPDSGGETETPNPPNPGGEIRPPDSGGTDLETDPPKPAVGTKLTDAKTKAQYTVTKSGMAKGTATYEKPLDKKRSAIVIPNMVKISGVSYKVTAVADGAFRGNKKIKTVVIGGSTASIGAKAFCQCTSLTKAVISESVSKIGKMAFYGCRKLKNIQIKTRALTSKNVGKNAFRGIYAKAVIKAPKKKLKAYKKLLKGKGIGKKVKVKKA